MKKSNFKKLLATASALAVLTGGVGTALGGAITTAANDAALSTDDLKWNGGAAPADLDSITVQAGQNHTIIVDAPAPIFIRDIQDGGGATLGGLDVQTTGARFGNIVVGNPGEIGFKEDVTTTLVGGTLADSGAATDYTGVSGVDFLVGGGGGTGAAILTLDTLEITLAEKVGATALGNHEIEFAANAEAKNTANATLNVRTDFKNDGTKSGTWAGIKNINIGIAVGDAKVAAGSAATLDLIADNVGAAGELKFNNVSFKHADSKLTLKNVASGGGANQDHISFANAVVGTADEFGKVTLESDGADLKAKGAGSLGTGANMRLKELNITGDKSHSIEVPVYAKTIDHGLNAGGANSKVVFTKVVDAGAGGLLKFTDANAGEVSFQANASIETVEFNNKANAAIKIGDGTTFTGNVYGHTAAAPNNAANAKGSVSMVGTSKLKGVLTNITKLTGGAANGDVSTLTAGDHRIGNIQLGNAGGTILFEDGANLLQVINNANAKQANTGIIAAIGQRGKLVFEGSSVIAGKIGNGAGMASITAQGGNGKVLNLQGAVLVGAGGLVQDGTGDIKLEGDTTSVGGGKFEKDGSITIENKKFTGAITNESAPAAVIGTLNLSGNSEITADIGAAAANKNIKLIDLKTGTARLDGNTYAQKVKFTNDDSILLLKGVGVQVHKFDEVELAGNKFGELHIEANNATLVSPGAGNTLNFGTEDQQMKKVQFVDNQELTLGDGVNIWAESLTNPGGNEGSLVFNGNNIFSAKNTAATKINAISTTGAVGTKAVIMEDMFANGAIAVGAGTTLEAKAVLNTANAATVAAGATLQVAGEYTATAHTTLDAGSTLRTGGNVTGQVNGVVNNNGKWIFDNTSNVTVANTVGNNKTLKAFEFAGTGDVKFNADVTTVDGNTYTFTNKDAEIKVEFNNNAAATKSVFVNNGDKTQTVILGAGASDFTGGAQLAETGNAIDFVIKNGVDTTISVAKATNANFLGDAANEGKLILNAKGLTINSVGKEGENIAKLTFTRDATVTESTYANEIDVNVPAVADTMVARFNGVISGNNLNLKGADSTAIFGDNVTVDTNIASDNNNEGIVTFEGNAIINKEFGALAKKVKVVNFANANNFTATLNKDIHATTINLNQTAVTLNSNVTLDATTVNRTGGAFNIGANNLVTNGKLIFSGDNVINLTVDANLASGTITANELDFTAGTKITISPPNSGSTPNIGDDKRIDLIVNSSGNAVANQLNSDNLILSTATIGFTKFTKGMDATTGAIYVMASNDAKNAMINRLGANADATDVKNAGKFAAAPIGTDGAKVRDTVLKLVSDKKLAEAYERIASTTATKTLDAVEGTTTEVNTGMSTRMNSLGGNQATGKSRTVASSDYVSGVSAGDDHSRIGAWFSPFYGQAIQKQRKGAAGYKSTSYGGTIGVDTKANADLLVGAALTVANSELSHRNFKAGDKTKINSLMFSVYGMYQLTDAWYAHTSATFGSNEVRNTEGRVTTGANEQVKGKYTAMSFTAEAMAGYNHVLDMLTVTPMMGARYTRVNASGYKETGSNTGQNLQVSSKASNKLDIIAGARVSGKTYAVNDVMITPEIHGFAAYDLIAKNPTQSAKLEGVGELAQKSVAPTKFTYNVGVGVNAEYGMMEYGAGYDATLASKRVGHQGTLRLRVNF